MGGKKLPAASLVVLAAALVAIASGCGGKKTLDRGELLDRANRICSDYEARQNEVQVPSVNPIDPKTSFTARARWGAALNQIVLLGHQEVTALRGLRPQKELEARYGELLDAKDTAFDGLGRAAEAALRNRPARVKTAARAAQAKLGKVTKLATQFGAEKCG